MNETMSEFDYEWNSGDDSESPCPPDLEELNGTSIVISYIVVFFLGLLGNAIVVYVVCTMKKHRTSTDIYLMHLAVADMLFSLTLPFWAVFIHKSNWIFGTFMCKLTSGIQEATVYSCVFLLACISIDRYMAIVKATQFLFKQDYIVRVVCALVWLGAILLSVPVIVQRDVIYFESYNVTYCYDNVTADKIYSWRIGLRVVRHSLGFFLPLSVMLVCYSCTIGTLFRSRNGQKHKAMRVILCVVLAFVICWLPNNVAEFVDTLRIGEYITDTCSFRQTLDISRNITQVLAFTHCAINPILYAFVGKKFRNHLLNLLFKKGVISRKLLSQHRAGSLYSSGSSRHTFVTL